MSKQKEIIHYGNLTKEEQQLLDKKKTFKNLTFCVLGSLIYSFAFAWILQLGGFFGGGVSGISQLIVGLFGKFSTDADMVNKVNNNLGTFIMILNIPLLLFGMKGVSKNFALYTLISIVVQGLVINLLSTYTISPFVYLMSNGKYIVEEVANGIDAKVVGKGLFDLIQEGNYHLFKAASDVPSELLLLKATMLPGTKMLLAMTGGALCGLGCSLCLKGGGSTGGLDIIANFLYNKKQINFAKFETAIDTIIITLSSIISLENVLYTLIRLFTYMLTINAFYKSYNIMRVEIITSEGDLICSKLLELFKHGFTVNDSVGGYTKEKKTTIIAYASEFEVNGLINVVKDLDEHAFITVEPANVVKSNFVKHTIS